MPSHRQGDVFAITKLRCFGLTVVFGHIGFNNLAPTWWKFREVKREWAEIRDPFSTLAGQSHEFRRGHYIWFVPTGENHGLPDRQLQETLDAAAKWARERGIQSLLTNGVANVDHGTFTSENRASNDHRADLMSEWSSAIERELGISVTLTSLNDVFVRRMVLADFSMADQKFLLSSLKAGMNYATARVNEGRATVSAVSMRDIIGGTGWDLGEDLHVIPLKELVGRN